MAEEKQISEDERYKYIGFETFGTKAGSFWKSDEERKSHIVRLKDQVGSVFRDSVVYSNVVSMTDRIAITIASLVMIVAPFLPWMRVETLYGTVTFTGFTGIMNLDGFWFYVEMLEGSVIPLTVYLTAALAYLSLLFGVATLVLLYLPVKSLEGFVGRLKTVLRLQLIPFLVFLFVILLGLITQKIPFGSHLGIDGLSGRYTVVDYIQFSSYGFWLAIFGFIMNFNKSKEL